MPMPVKEYLSKMGIDHPLHPYETVPWSHYDADEEITANADIAMNAGGDEIEAELLYIRDNPDEGQAPVELMMWMKIIPYNKEDWKTAALKVKGEDHAGKTYDWEVNACDVFRKCKNLIQAGQIPDFDDIFEQEFFKGGSGGRRGGRGGGKKSPKINPEAMPGMGRKV